jgi:hypothetical protein
LIDEDGSIKFKPNEMVFGDLEDETKKKVGLLILIISTGLLTLIQILIEINCFDFGAYIADKVECNNQER